ncbi:MAG: hypothetical protein JWM80_150 [Cyanobacteria bacterium RYN_339]|nr:hypothetical protein [Cyanobacteria bacterium RYN_339]
MRLLLCLSGILLTACQATVTAAHKATPTVAPTAATGPANTAVASAAPAAILVRPSGAVTELAGTVGMDVGYVVGAGRGQVLSNNGGNVLALGGGGVLSNNGGNLISDHGGGVVAAAEGNVVAGFRLLAGPPARGLLPTAGAVVRVTSLATGLPLTLGVDAQGKPVSAVYSNVQGAFKLFIPASEAGNVLVQVAAPGEGDARLQYDLFADPRASAMVDDDTDLVTRYVRTVFTARMVTILAEPGAKALDTILASADNTQNPAVKELLRGIVQDLNGAARAAGVPTSPSDAKVQELANRLIDVLMSSLGPPGQLQITKLMAPEYPGPDAPVFAALAQVMKSIREGTERKLAEDPGFFKSHLFDFKDGTGALVPAAIPVVKAADPGAYLVKEFLLRNQVNGFRNADHLMLDLQADRGADGIKHADRLEAGTYALLGAITLALTPDGAAHAPVLATIKSFSQAQGWQP